MQVKLEAQKNVALRRDIRDKLPFNVSQNN